MIYRYTFSLWWLNHNCHPQHRLLWNDNIWQPQWYILWSLKQCFTINAFITFEFCHTSGGFKKPICWLRVLRHSTMGKEQCFYSKWWTKQIAAYVCESYRVLPSRHCRLHSRPSGCTAGQSRYSSRLHSGTWTASHRWCSLVKHTNLSLDLRV